MKKIKILVLVAAFGASLSPVRAEEAKAKTWKNETEFSYVSANGNTKATSTSGKNTYTNKWAKTALELIGGGNGTNSNQQTTAEKYYASEKVAYSLSERNYAFEKGSWDKDRFAGVKNRYEGTAGLGRDLIKKPKDLLIFELGSGYTSEERYNQKRNSFQTGRAYSKYTHTISETAKFSQDAEYQQNFENPNDFRVKTESAIVAALSVHFSLKTAFLWQHVGVPPKGFTRNDTSTVVSIIASY